MESSQRVTEAREWERERHCERYGNVAHDREHVKCKTSAHAQTQTHVRIHAREEALRQDKGEGLFLR